jgi:hypothetical protein
MVHLPGIDQVPALAPAEIKAIPFGTIEREPGDGQRLALSAGFLDPIVGPTGRVAAISYLRDDTLKASLASMLVHLATIDLEALTELNIGLGNDLLEQRLALD